MKKEQIMDDPAARELHLYLENDATIYRQRLQPIHANLRKKIAKKIYQRELAVKAFMYAVDDAAKKYAKEFADAKDWSMLFPKNIRTEVARRMVKDFEAEEGIKK